MRDRGRNSQAKFRAGQRLRSAFHTRRRTRAGSMMSAATNSNAPPTAMPTNRKGSNSSQTIGYRTSANKASGQHSTNRMHHNRKPSMEEPPLVHTLDYARMFRAMERETGFEPATSTLARLHSTS